MSNFIPRTTAPNPGDPFYTNVDFGGYNRCIVRDWSNGFTLPNCTGYAFGRFMECQGFTQCNLSVANASQWYSYPDGYARGQTPKLGAVACWGGGAYGGAGHVAVVEQINGDGSVILSESNYSGGIFQMRQCDASMHLQSPYTFWFQGFIYPTVDFDGGGDEPIDPPIPPDPDVDQKKRLIMLMMMYAKIRREREEQANGKYYKRIK